MIAINLVAGVATAEAVAVQTGVQLCGTISETIIIALKAADG